VHQYSIKKELIDLRETVMEQVIQKIVDIRLKKIHDKGVTFGYDLPADRTGPVVLPDFEQGVMICEIKRGSPSEGRMNDIPDPVELAGIYKDGGAGAISILTEEDHFFGSLADLMAVKTEYPNLPLLRKDFILSIEEIDISYRAGADLVLLITSIFMQDKDGFRLSDMKAMIKRTLSLGMLPLIEVHDREELEAVLPMNPDLIGINTRDLKTFVIKRGIPYGMLDEIPVETHVVYESGIKSGADSFFPGSAGFSAILVGSSLVKSSDPGGTVRGILNGFHRGLGSQGSRFYSILFNRIYYRNERVVKVCGITMLEDARAAVELGADVIGFVLADSPRQVSIEVAREISLALGDSVLKVAVVVDSHVDKAVQGINEGWLDAVQLHGSQDNEEASQLEVPWYKAVRAAAKEDFDVNWSSPLVLYDAFSREAAGGTGKRIDKILLDYALDQGIELAVAGGLTPANVEELIVHYNPVMLDVSSGLEESPGRKSMEKMEQFFSVVNDNRLRS
jgi:indole-3-glycerol phosphate synthase/phosphoribosylanthranilate isomerase